MADEPKETPDPQALQVPKKRLPWPLPFNIFQEEWPEVRKARVSFILAVIAGGCVGGLTVLWLFSYFIISGKDATISALIAQLGANKVKPNEGLKLENGSSDQSSSLTSAHYSVSDLRLSILDIRPKALEGSEFQKSDNRVSRVLVNARVKNLGAASSASDWELEVILPDGRSEASAALPVRSIDWGQTNISVSETLEEKTFEKKIAPHSGEEGWLEFRIPFAPSTIEQKMNVFVLSVKDETGNRSEGRFTNMYSLHINESKP